jgi:TPR repeat protein
MSVPPDLKMAALLFDRACRMSPGGCIRSAILLQGGQGVTKDEKKAKELYDRSCNAHAGGLSSIACYVSAKLYGGGEPKIDKGALEHTSTVMKPQCDQSSPRACTFLAVAELALGKKPAGEADLKKGCDMKDAWACDLQKRLKGK